MSDLQNEVQFLSEELDKARERLAHADEHYRSLATICEAYHALLFGDGKIPAKDENLVMRTIAYSFAVAMVKNGARSIATQDFTMHGIPGHPEAFRVNVMVQRVEGKSPLQLLEEQKLAIEAMTSALALFDPELAETIALSRIEEIPEVVEKWSKTHAIAANPAQSTPST